MTPEQITRFRVLLASARQGVPLSFFAKEASMAGAMKTLGEWGLGASVVAGAGTGYGLARLTEPDVDPEEAQKQELIAAYKMYTDHAQRMAKRYAYRPSPPRMQRLRLAAGT